MKLRPFLMPVLFTTLFACKSTSDESPNDVVETFVPEITQDGTKLFTYEIAYLEVSPQGRNSGRGSRGRAGGSGTRSGSAAGGRTRGGGGARPSQPPQAVPGADLGERVESYIVKVEYCEEGFVELDSEQLDDRKFSVRGECLDSATDEDREKWI